MGAAVFGLLTMYADKSLRRQVFAKKLEWVGRIGGRWEEWEASGKYWIFMEEIRE